MEARIETGEVEHETDATGVERWLGDRAETSRPVAAMPFESPAERRTGAMLPAARREDAWHYRLVLRFAAFNLAAFALLAAAWGQGWIGHIVAADVTSISVGIFIVFLGGLALCARAVWDISTELNTVRAAEPDPHSWTEQYLAEVAGRDAGSRAIVADALRARLAARIASVRHVSNSLVLLGLIGTVLGFVIALSGVDPTIAGDVGRVTPMVAKLVEGMSVALYTTLVGAVLHLWLSTGYHMLAGGTSRLASAVIARGERHA